MPSLNYTHPRLANRAVHDVARVASLDFSLRIFRPINLSHYHLMEQHTECGANARSFNVSRVYDQSGREVAQMNQVSIIRPLEGDGSPALGTETEAGMDRRGGEYGLGTAVSKGTESQPKERTSGRRSAKL